MSNTTVQHALNAITSTYAKVEIVSIDGLTACFGTLSDGKIETTYVGNLPPFSEGAVKRLYNAKWSQRQIGYLYGMSQPKIAAIMKSRTTTVPHTLKGY